MRVVHVVETQMFSCGRARSIPMHELSKSTAAKGADLWKFLNTKRRAHEEYNERELMEGGCGQIKKGSKLRKGSDCVRSIRVENDRPRPTCDGIVVGQGEMEGKGLAEFF